MQRGHVIIMEGQPCAGMFFIVTGQVAILARRPSSAAINAGDSGDELTQHASSELQASYWSPGPTSSWWGQAGADQHAAGEHPKCSCCFILHLCSAHVLPDVSISNYHCRSAFRFITETYCSTKHQASGLCINIANFAIRIKPWLFVSLFVDVWSSQDRLVTQHLTCAHTQSSSNTKGALLLQQ